MKTFYAVATALTVTLCLGGCGSDDSSEGFRYKIGQGGADVRKSPAAADNYAVGGYVTGSRRETLVTAPVGGDSNNAETVLPDPQPSQGQTTEDISNRGNVSDERSQWFAAHTLFNMQPGEDNSFFSGTWYRFNNSGDTYTTTAVLFEPRVSSTGLKDSQKMPDTLLTKAPANGGGTNNNNNNNNNNAANRTNTNANNGNNNTANNNGNNAGNNTGGN